MKKNFLVLIALFVFFAPAISFASTDNLERIFYYADYRKEEGLKSIAANASKIDIVAPQSYYLSSGLYISGKVDPDLKKIALQNNIKVMPLIVNSKFSQATMHKLLTTSPKIQDMIVNFLVKEALANKYIGWQFDFENISCKDRDLYTAFIKRTALAFKKKNLVLSVAAVVRTNDKTDTDAYKNWSGVFDYEKIAKHADFISLMAYDDPESKGPTASVPFVKAVLDYMEGKIPPEKISLGIPLYYWGWSVEPYKRVVSGGSFASLLSVMQRFAYQLGFDEDLGVPWVYYLSNNGKEYKIWHENNISFAIKLGIVKDNNLRGFSAWVLGAENPGIWFEL